MGILDEIEKDKIWSHMNDMRALGMTRKDLDDDDELAEELKNDK